MNSEHTDKISLLCMTFTHNLLLSHTPPNTFTIYAITIDEIKWWKLCHILYRTSSYLNPTSFILKSLYPYFWNTSFHAQSFVYFHKVSHMYFMQYNYIVTYTYHTLFITQESRLKSSSHVKPCLGIHVCRVRYLRTPLLTG